MIRDITKRREYDKARAVKRRQTPEYKEYQKAYRLKNAEKLKEYQKEYQNKLKDKKEE